MTHTFAGLPGYAGAHRAWEPGFDHIQKTAFPAGARHYHRFKHTTLENRALADFINRTCPLKKGELVLDVGSRNGNVAFGVQDARYVHLVDPDPRVRWMKKPAHAWRQKIQDVRFAKQRTYKCIILCHVLGYLSLQGAEAQVLEKLLSMLEVGGTLVLFYNSNKGYMADLIEYSRHVYPMRHWDFFDETLLDRYRTPHYSIKQRDFAFEVKYPNFERLAECCWFLFGTVQRDIKAASRVWLPKLKKDLAEPCFVIDERVVTITRRE